MGRQWLLIASSLAQLGGSCETVVGQQLQLMSSASLKFTVINTKGRIWTMVARGGASVIYADTVGDLGYAYELGGNEPLTLARAFWRIWALVFVIFVLPSFVCDQHRW